MCIILQISQSKVWNVFHTVSTIWVEGTAYLISGDINYDA